MTNGFKHTRTDEKKAKNKSGKQDTGGKGSQQEEQTHKMKKKRGQGESSRSVG